MEKKVYSFYNKQQFCHYYVNRQRLGVHFPNTNACFSNWHGVIVHGLCTKVVKLEQVEGLGNSLSTVITFYLFLQGFP